MSKISRKIDGRPTPVHQVTAKNVDGEEWEPDEVTFSVIKDGRKYRVMFSCPIMSLDEWMSPFSSKMDAINFAENMAEATCCSVARTDKMEKFFSIFMGIVTQMKELENDSRGIESLDSKCPHCEG